MFASEHVVTCRLFGPVRRLRHQPLPDSLRSRRCMGFRPVLPIAQVLLPTVSAALVAAPRNVRIRSLIRCFLLLSATALKANYCFFSIARNVLAVHRQPRGRQQKGILQSTHNCPAGIVHHR